MRRALAALALAASFPAAAQVFVVDPAHTFPTFAVDHLGIATQKGRFDATTGRIELDPAKGTASVAIEIDAKSVSTGNPKIDALLRGEDFLDVAAHPKITFRATRVEYKGEAPARIEGELTLRGVTKPLALTVERYACTSKPFLVRITCGADAAGRFSRAAFGISTLAAFVGDEIRLEIQVEAVRQEAQQVPVSGG